MDALCARHACDSTAGEFPGRRLGREFRHTPTGSHCSPAPGRGLDRNPDVVIRDVRLLEPGALFGLRHRPVADDLAHVVLIESPDITQYGA